MATTNTDIKTYFVTIPAHKYLHIRNYESIGYWDFWQKQSQIPGQDCDTICGPLSSIPGKLDDAGGEEEDSGSGRVMGFINAPRAASAPGASPWPRAAASVSRRTTQAPSPPKCA